MTAASLRRGRAARLSHRAALPLPSGTSLDDKSLTENGLAAPERKTGRILLIACGAVGAMEGAVRKTIEYVKERKAFGKSIMDFQNTKFKLAECKTNTVVARSFLDNCIEAHLKGELTVETAAMAKYWTTDLQGKILDECVQLHGGYGFMMEYDVAEMWTDARVQRIYGGTNEIMKDLISRKL